MKALGRGDRRLGQAHRSLCAEMEDRASNFCKGLFDFDYDKGKQFLQAIKVLEELPTTEDSGAKLAAAVETLSKGSKA
jgi:hypothetical protein